MNLQQFQSWSLGQGQVGNPGNGSFPGQCVSLVQQYLDKVYGIPYQARGNAVDWPSNGNVLSHFDKVGDLQVGDIIVYGADYGGGYGHIGIGIGNGQILDQNGRKTLHVATGNIYKSPSNPVAYLRRKGGNDMINIDQVKDLYRVFLGREASNAEAQTWVGEWANAFYSIKDSDEAHKYEASKKANHDEVKSQFNVYLGVNPTPEEYNSWVGQELKLLQDTNMASPQAAAYQQKVKDALAGGGKYEQVTVYRKVS